MTDKRKEKDRTRSLGEYSSGEGKNEKNRNLQIEKTNRLPSDLFTAGTRRVFLWISKKKRKCRASLTVEAAMVVPMVIFLIATLLSVFDFYRVQSQVRASIHESAMQLGVYAFSPEGSRENLLRDGFCVLYGTQHLPDLGENVKVSFWGTSCRGGKVHMSAHISYHPVIQVIPVPPLRAHCRCSVNIWDGWDGTEEEDSDDEDDQMVYVAENESVYHTSAFCTHLNLAIYQDLQSNMSSKRNCYGEKYTPCEKCGSGANNMIVYYSEKGSKYHTNPQCSGIKRRIHLVKKSQIGNLPMCQRCRERMGK